MNLLLFRFLLQSFLVFNSLLLNTMFIPDDSSYCRREWWIIKCYHALFIYDDSLYYRWSLYPDFLFKKGLTFRDQGKSQLYPSSQEFVTFVGNLYLGQFSCPICIRRSWLSHLNFSLQPLNRLTLSITFISPIFHYLLYK